MTALQPLESLQDYHRRVVMGPPFPAGDEMKFEQLRIGSFCEWPRNSHQSPNQLSKAGLYHVGGVSSDEVKCFSCKVRISNWRPDDVPLERHRRESPSCLFLQEKDNWTGRLLCQEPSTDCPDHGELPNYKQPLAGASRTSALDLDIRREVQHGSPDDTEYIALSSGLRPGLVRPRASLYGQYQAQSLNGSHVRDTSHDLLSLPVDINHNQQLSTKPKSEHSLAKGHDKTSNKEHFSLGHYPEENDETDNIHQDFYSLNPVLLPQHGQTLTGRNPSKNIVTNNHITSDSSSALKDPIIQQSLQADRATSPTKQSRKKSKKPNTVKQDPRRSKDTEYLNKMKNEVRRIKTFHDWPSVSPQKPSELAAAGFFFTGQLDHTRCAFCGQALYNWLAEDVPMKEHCLHYPNCPFVLGEDVGNIPDPDRVAAISERSDNEGDMQEHRAHANLPPEQPKEEPAADTKPEASAGAAMSTPPEQSAREVSTHMDTSAVQAVLEMGFPYEQVQQLVEERVREGGGGIPDSETLMEILLAMEDTSGTDPGSTMAGGTEAASINPPPSIAGGTGESPDLDLLRSENMELKEERLCMICQKREACIVFLPCTHLITCASCSNRKKCPNTNCNKRIKQTVQIFRS